MRMGEGARARFWAKVEKTEGCWNWMAAKSDGYGILSINRGPFRAHRLAWEDAFGPIPEGMCILHHCDNRGCVRPSHLFVGTKADNQADMVQKNRQAQGERNGRARLTEADVVAIRREYATDKHSQQYLGMKYGTSQGEISHIVTRKTWKCAGGPRGDEIPKGRRARGERSSNAKLTTVDVLAIRREYADGRQTQKAIGIRYGIGDAQVSKIVRGCAWGHVG